jgi:hypothetical protein
MDLLWVVQTGRLKHRNCPKVGTECTANAEASVQWNVSPYSVVRCIHDMTFSLEQAMKAQRGVEI